MGSANRVGKEWTILNILMIMSDEHSHQVMGCSGHPVVRTPNLDRLAGEGVQFTNCYTNSPLCAPARASLFTSRYVHQLGTWDNTTPYDGNPPGISQYLARYGHRLASFGKWDFHPDGVYEGLQAELFGVRKKPDLEGLFRESGMARHGTEKRFHDMGVREGASHDEQVLEAALRWLRERKQGERPWVLYLGFTQPHFPFYVKKEFWDSYSGSLTELPESAVEPFTSLNEPLLALRHHFRGDAADREVVKRAHEGYYASVSELDQNLGRIFRALEETGLDAETLVIYTSDHGEQLGHHGLWWKCCMFEESAHVPLIMRGPGLQHGARIDTLVSLVDMFPTVCRALDLPEPSGLAGRSLLDPAMGRTDTGRADFVFSEYHAHGMPVGMFMIRWRQWKYVYFVGYRPQLFDLETDPGEARDLAGAGSLFLRADGHDPPSARRMREQVTFDLRSGGGGQKGQGLPGQGAEHVRPRRSRPRHGIHGGQGFPGPASRGDPNMKTCRMREKAKGKREKGA